MPVLAPPPPTPPPDDRPGISDPQHGASPSFAAAFLIFSLFYVGLEYYCHLVRFSEIAVPRSFYWTLVGTGTLLGVMMIFPFCVFWLGGWYMAWQIHRLKAHCPDHLEWYIQQLAEHEAKHGLSRRDRIALWIGTLGAVVMLLPAFRILTGLW